MFPLTDYWIQQFIKHEALIFFFFFIGKKHDGKLWYRMGLENDSEGSTLQQTMMMRMSWRKLQLHLKPA